MKSNFSRPFRFNSWISTKRYQKKVTETKAQKILDRILKMAFFTPWFLGFTTLQQSLLIINFSFGIFVSEYQRKNLLKCTRAISESVKVVDFDGLFLTAIFAQ